MLNPRMRLKVFENLQCQQDWIHDVKEKFHMVYNDYYACKEPSNLGARSEINIVEAYNMESAVRLQVKPERPGTSSSSSARHAEIGFDDCVFGLPETPIPQSQIGSLVDFYLEEDCAGRRADPVQWWKLNAH